MGLIEKYARGLNHEQLIEEYLRLVVKYEERGMAMVETGDMVRSLYIPQITKLREILEMIVVNSRHNGVLIPSEVVDKARQILKEDKKWYL